MINPHPYPPDRLEAVAWAKSVVASKSAVVLDTETTGLGNDDEIIHLAIYQLDGEPLLNTLIKPSGRLDVPLAATRIHGLKTRDLDGQPYYVDLQSRLDRLLSGKKVLAYNARFDSRMMLQSSSFRGGYRPVLAHWECVMEMYAKFFGEYNPRYQSYRWRKLPGNHSADGDVLATIKLIEQMAAYQDESAGQSQQRYGATKTSSRSTEPASPPNRLRALKMDTTNLEKLLTRKHTLYGAVLLGLDGLLVELQGRAMAIKPRGQSWHSAVQITGMPRGAVREAKDRIVGAFRACGIPDPQVDLLINLTPPDIPKDGTWLDLPLAVLMLQVAGLLPDLPEQQEAIFILAGELDIHGAVRRVPGVLSLAFMAQPGQKLIIPAGNEKEAALILAKPGHEGCGIFPVSDLQAVIDFFSGKKKLENALKQRIKFEDHSTAPVDFGRIKGQDAAKNAAVVAAAGGHNLLLIGPPGEGKSMLASAIPGILPRLTNEEKVQLTRIYSAAGELNRDGLAVTKRPMRSIHHTASKQSVIGGGAGTPSPGEITRAHLGVLFLDEVAEFASSTLEALRQPLEIGEVTISRVGGSYTYPCRFTLVAAMNPCPCGYAGTERCRCSALDIKKYQGKISGPILDRIDMQVVLKPLSTKERFATTADNETVAMRRRVEKARERQIIRFAGTGIPFNAAIPGGMVSEYCDFSEQGLQFFMQLVDAHSLSTRAVDRLAKVSRTVADLGESAQIAPEHVEQATALVINAELQGSSLGR